MKKHTKKKEKKKTECKSSKFYVQRSDQNRYPTLECQNECIHSWSFDLFKLHFPRILGNQTTTIIPTEVRLVEIELKCTCSVIWIDSETDFSDRVVDSLSQWVKKTGIQRDFLFYFILFIIIIFFLRYCLGYNLIMIIIYTHNFEKFNT